MKTLTRKLKISRVWIEHKIDANPDLSYLGSYSQTLSEFSFVRGKLSYFTATNHRNIDEWDHVSDADVLKAYEKEIQTGYQELSRESMIEALNAHYREQDYKRMEAYNAGQWHMIGIIAKAEIISPAGIVQTLRSGGLWSIESDSGKEYLDKVAKEQLSELRGELESMGLGNRAIAHAFRNVEIAE